MIISFIKRHKLLLGLLIVLPTLGFVGYSAFQSYYCSAAPATPPEQIKGEIITLRLLTENDYVDYQKMFSSTVRKSLEFPEFTDLSYIIYYLNYEQKKIAEGKMVHYCIFDNKENKLIGSIEVRDKNDTDPGQFGCWLNEAYWGGGRIQEAIKLIVPVYFKLRPNEQSFIAHVRTWNPRSHRALQKAGFKDIGYFYEDGKPTRFLMEYKRP